MSTYFENWKQFRVEFLGFSFGVHKRLNNKLKETDSFRAYVNFSFSDLKYQFKRKTIWAFHRARHGWAAPDTWSFDYYLAGVIIEGIEHLKKYKYGIPSSMQYGDRVELDKDGTPIEKYTFEQAEKRWDQILTDIVDGFKAWKVMTDEHPGKEEYERLEKQFHKGMKLFHKHYGGLWD